MRMQTGLGVLAGLACVGGPAVAATTTQTFNVTLTIVAQCVIRSTATLAFGSSIGVLGGSGGTANNDAQTTVAVQCTDTTAYDIGLDGGANSGDPTGLRLMKGSGAATVGYKLCTDAACNTNWGNSVGSDTVHATGNGNSQSYTIYGRIPPQHTPAPDAYTDTVTVTVTY